MCDGLRAGQSLRLLCEFLVLCDVLLGHICDSVAVPKLPLNSARDYVGDREITPPYGYL